MLYANFISTKKNKESGEEAMGRVRTHGDEPWMSFWRSDPGGGFVRIEELKHRPLPACGLEAVSGGEVFGFLWWFLGRRRFFMSFMPAIWGRWQTKSTEVLWSLCPCHLFKHKVINGGSVWALRICQALTGALSNPSNNLRRKPRPGSVGQPVTQRWI